jgi:signal transduction histidine kinase
MKRIPRSLPLSYQKALREHVAEPGEDTLRNALRLGQAAVAGGMGVADLIRVHHRALSEDLLAPDGPPAARIRFASALDSFLVEALSPFGVAGSTRDRLLKSRIGDIEELALRNGELEEEIADRKRAEAATQASKDHYFALYQNARAMEANLRELSAQVLTAQEEERKRISRELHDEIGQALTAIDVSIAMLKRQAASNPAFQRNVADAEQLLERTMETVHSFARELRPAMLDHLGLESAFRAHMLTFERQTGIKTELVIEPDVTRLDERRGEVLFRVAQEALNNIYKHAGATTAKVEFLATDGSIAMEIADNGHGYNVEKQARGKLKGRLGVLGMQERVRLVNGSISIVSTPATGTRVRVNIPLEARTRETAGKVGPGRWPRAARVPSLLPVGSP